MTKETNTNETNIAVIQNDISAIKDSMIDMKKTMDKLSASFVTTGDFNVLKLEVSYMKRINIFLISAFVVETIAFIFKLTVYK